MTNKIDQIVNDFNSLSLDLARQIGKICPNSIVANNIDTLEMIIRKSETKRRLIELFVGNVLQYKEKIESGDESFFLKKTYEDHLEGNEYYISKVFEFKNIWHELSPDNKRIVKEFMSILLILGQEYFVQVFGI